MSTVPTQRLTPAEYLARERAAEFKSEFYKGEMFAMAGANNRHVRICVNLIVRLEGLLRDSGCQVFNSDMRVKVSRSIFYTYPDVTIACGPQFEDETQDVLLNPCVIIEVLSKSTERRDRGWKFHNYWNIPSLVDYVLVSQDRPLVEQFVHREDGNWLLRHFEGLDETLGFAAVDCSILLRDIYREIAFGPDDDRPVLVEATNPSSGS
jgi:Uma2 family endonuclease